MRRHLSARFRPALTVLGVCLALSSLTYGQQRGADASTMYYVSADAGPAGDGSRRRPFLLLAHAESASAAGDTIYLLSSDRGQLLDGGIALKPRQKLIGIGVNGEMLENAADRVQLTNTTALPGGVMVHLSEHNEVAGIHFMNMGNVAISGSDTDYSGTYIHHTTFSGNAREHIEDERGLVYAISFGSPDIKVGRSPGRSDQELCDLGRNRLIHGFFWDLPEQYFLASVDGRLRRPRSGWGACSAAAKSRRKVFNL